MLANQDKLTGPETKKPHHHLLSATTNMSQHTDATFVNRGYLQRFLIKLLGPLIRSFLSISGFMLALINVLVAVSGNWSTAAANDSRTAPPLFVLEQIEDRITLAESQLTDIRPGLEKSIIWAGAPHHRTEYAIVYIHGFSASKEELRPVPDRIASALDANIFYTRLTGHGRTAKAMHDVSVAAWMQD